MVSFFSVKGLVMSRKPILQAVTVVCVLCGIVAPSLFQSCAQDDRAGRWQHDIDYLVRRLEIMHPNLYANISTERFHTYADELKESVAKSDDIQIIFGIQELVARIGSVHTSCTPVLFMNGHDDLKRLFGYYPLRYYPFEDGLFVIATPEKYKGILGTKVVRIGSLATEEVMNKLARFVAATSSLRIRG